jgi:hypothetical protein
MWSEEAVAEIARATPVMVSPPPLVRRTAQD